MSFVNVVQIGGSSRPNKVTARHAAQMLGTQDINIKFVLPEVQHQIGASDSGLFGLAFATSIFFGEDSSTLQYNQNDEIILP